MCAEDFRQTLGQLAAIVESAHDAIIGQNQEGRITSWNRGAHDLFGFSFEEAVGRAGEFIVPDELQVEECEYVEQIMAGEHVAPFDTRRLHRDGHLIDVSLTLSPVKERDGTVVGMSKIAHDITQRKRIERKLAHLAAIVDSSDDAIVSTDLDGVIDSWNQGATRLLGYSPDEVIGKHAGFLLPPGAGDEERPLRRVIEGGERIQHYETTRRHKNGSIVSLSLCLSPIRDRNGQVIGVSGIARDITEHKWFEEAEQHRIEAQKKIQLLTEREREVLDGILSGNANKVIARRLQLSEKTVEKHRSRLMKKLDVRSVAELVRIALSAVA